MTNEEAVKQIKENCYFASISERTKQALNKAIQALEQQPCEDCISRQAALDCFEQTNTRQGAKYAIETLSSVTPRTNLALTSQDCISREEVQDLISRWLSDYLLDETREALETINYKVGDMPSVIPQTVTEFADKCKECGKIQNELSKDAVSRSELLSHDFIITAQNGISHRVIYATRVEEAPSVIPQRKMGKWIEDTQTGFKIRCSECGARNFGADRAYCPRCGRQMKEDSND